MKITGAIFDMDGTLLDSMYIWRTVGENYLRSIGIEPEKGLNEKFAVMSLADSVAYCKERYNVELSVDKLIDGVNALATDYYLHEAKPKDNIIAFLKKLKAHNVKICVATATDRPLVEATLKVNNMLEYFDEIFTCTAIGHSKEEPHIFNEALNFMGTKKEETWVFEDALYAVKTVKANNFNVVGIYDKYEKRTSEVKERTDIYIHSYDELDSYFEL